MKALILNSGLGSRMGDKVTNHPKCMTELPKNETILSRQIDGLVRMGVEEIIITTGYLSEVLEEYCGSLEKQIHITFVKNENYQTTNYIYSIYCARDYLYDSDMLILHGDLVFDHTVLLQLLLQKNSVVTVSSTIEPPQKDFKAVITGNRVKKIGVDYFDNVAAAQPLYFLKKEDWNIWLNEIIRFCESGKTDCYAEDAFNSISDKCRIEPFDIKDSFCMEVDTEKDLETVKERLSKITEKTVYMCFSTDIVHGGHVALIKKASCYGKVIIGVMTDEAVAGYKRFPLIPYSERKNLFGNLKYVSAVVAQSELSYKNNLDKYRPDYVIHGDDWRIGVQKPIRDEVIQILSTYGGMLIEFPYSQEGVYNELEKRARNELSLPDLRRARLKKLLQMKPLITVMEAHDGITGLIVENTICNHGGETHQFDAIWVSSLCDSVAKGKPDIELVDMTSRYRTIDDIMEVTTKPVIFDGDTGGITEHFVYTVRTLERMGVSMIIIEDKTGLKKNSLFGTEVLQTQDTIENFCAKISAGKSAQKSNDFMICARIESLILEKGLEDAVTRAVSYVKAGADALMIHSRKREPDEVFAFVKRYRMLDAATPIVAVPSSYSAVTEAELKEAGVNIVIYANQLTRSGVPAMQKAALTILENHRAKECDEFCMSIKDIITLIPEEVG